MAKTASLFPESAGPRERAISAAVAQWWDIPVEILDTLWNPLTCPPAVLPHLARALGMPLWPDRWTLSQKRLYAQRWIVLSRHRGVEGTFRELLAQLDIPLVEFRAPPQGLFPKHAWTDAERDAFRAQYPELRVYPYRTRHVTRGALVVGQPWFGSRAILRHSVAPAFAGRRATVVDRGVERAIPIRVEVGTGEFARGIFTVTLPTTAPKLILPVILGRGFVPRISDAAARVYRYSEGDGRGPDLLPPGEPFALTPDKVRAPHHVRKGNFVVGHCLPMILRPSEAPDHVYDSVRLYDPARTVVQGAPKRGGWILGRTKFRQAAFTLRLSVDLERKRPGGFVVGHALPMVVRRQDETRTREALAGARAAKLGRDRVLVKTNLHRPVQIDDRIPVDGSFRVGQIIRGV